MKFDFFVQTWRWTLCVTVFEPKIQHHMLWLRNYQNMFTKFRGQTCFQSNKMVPSTKVPCSQVHLQYNNLMFSSTSQVTWASQVYRHAKCTQLHPSTWASSTPCWQHAFKPKVFRKRVSVKHHTCFQGHGYLHRKNSFSPALAMLPPATCDWTAVNAETPRAPARFLPFTKVPKSNHIQEA